MKLKFLFFPFSLVVAAVTTIWFIWPTWFDDDGIATTKKEIQDRNTEIGSIRIKKNNIESLRSSLESEISSKNLTDRYYPQEKNTETIINEINYFSSSSGASVSNISVSIMDTGRRSSRAGGGKNSCLPVSSKGGKSVLMTDTDDDSRVAIEESQAVVMDVEIDVVGDYTSIKNFATRVGGMEIINNVYAMNIGKDVDVRTAEGDGNILKAKLKACFGYLPGSVVYDEGNVVNHRIFSMNEFDFSYVEKMNEAIYRPASSIEIGSSGKDNPFAP